MTFACIVPTCTNNTDENWTLSFFRIPKDDVRRAKWLTNINREDLLETTPTYSYNNFRVCMMHFENDMFSSLSKNRLHIDAEPVMNITGPPSQSEFVNCTVVDFENVQHGTPYDGDIEMDSILTNDLETPQTNSNGALTESSCEDELKSDIKECCIACLTKSADMHNLNQQEEKRYMFTTMFNVELDNYSALPQFLCSACDTKLNDLHNFQEAVRNCLAILEEYNAKLMVKEEVIDEEYKPTIEVDKCSSEEGAVQLNEGVHQTVAGIKIEPSEEADRVVEEFADQHYQSETCVLCGFEATSRTAIFSHMAISHKDGKDNWCLECNKSFENYEEHKQTHNAQEFDTSRCVEQLQSTFPCTFCNKAFKSASWLRKHKRVHHTKDEPFSCPNCSKCFIHLSSLQDHLGTHGKFSCNSCKKRYKSAEELEGHICATMEDSPLVNEVWIKTDDRAGYQTDKIEEAIILKRSKPVGCTFAITMDTQELPECIEKNAQKATESLPSPKFSPRYEREYEIFQSWQSKNKVPAVTEAALLAYFEKLSENYSPNSLWTKYSLLKSTLMVNMQIDISSYNQLISFLKVKSKGYTPKKSLVLTGDQVLAFIKGAPDDTYLLHKVVLVMGVFGGLRRDQMVKMSIDDISDKGSVLVVKVPEMKTTMCKGFTIVEEDEIGALKLIRRYIALRPKHMKERRFFLSYRNGRCTVQPVGKNTIGGVPNIIAKYLKLENPHQYTGHCLRRTSSTLQIETGASFETIKMHGKWKNNTVAQSYVEGSITSKNPISNIIASVVGSSQGETLRRNICKTNETSPFANFEVTRNFEESEPTSTCPIGNKRIKSF